MRLVTDVMREIRKGRGVDLASRMLAEVVRAVDETQKKGSLTITLTVTPDKGGGAGKTISLETKSKKPVLDIPAAQFFSDPSGDLHRTDPDQQEMFNEVNKGEPRSGPRPVPDIEHKPQAHAG